MSVTFNDYSDEVLAAFEEGCLRALERCGLQAEGYAKDLCQVDTGALRNSINHKVDPGEPAAYVGSPDRGRPSECERRECRTRGRGRPPSSSEADTPDERSWKCQLCPWNSNHQGQKQKATRIVSSIVY